VKPTDRVARLHRSRRQVEVMADFLLIIEELSITGAIRKADSLLNHVHPLKRIVLPADVGDINFKPVLTALTGIRYH
jgi:hypothetical protein